MLITTGYGGVRLIVENMAMNKKDLERMRRMMFIMKGVPKNVSGGTQTTDIQGLIGYTYDMRTLQSALTDFFINIQTENHWIKKTDLDEFEAEYGEPLSEFIPDYCDPDDILDGIEAWLKVRGSDGWDTKLAISTNINVRSFWGNDEPLSSDSDD